MENASIFTVKQEASRLESLVSKLDDVGFEAIFAFTFALLQGKSEEQAIAAGNKILIADGRAPLPPLHPAKKEIVS